ncbi:MAG: hypothetical protein ACJA0V_004220, partial [Planctomycetota bacterium]
HHRAPRGQLGPVEPFGRDLAATTIVGAKPNEE